MNAYVTSDTLCFYLKLKDVAVVAVVDLYGGSIQATKPEAASVRTRNNLFLPPTRCKVCKLHFVDPQLFLSRPGLIVLQVHKPRLGESACRANLLIIFISFLYFPWIRRLAGILAVVDIWHS